MRPGDVRDLGRIDRRHHAVRRGELRDAAVDPGDVDRGVALLLLELVVGHSGDARLLHDLHAACLRERIEDAGLLRLAPVAAIGGDGKPLLRARSARGAGHQSSEIVSARNSISWSSRGHAGGSRMGAPRLLRRVRLTTSDAAVKCWRRRTTRTDPNHDATQTIADVIYTHTEGEPLCIIHSGIPYPSGSSILEKRAFLESRLRLAAQRADA